MIENNIRSAMLLSAAVTALVGVDASDTAARIYYTDLKQGGNFPAISLFQVSGNRGRILKGPDGWNTARYQIDTWAKTFSQCRKLWDAMRLAIDGYKDISGNKPIALITLQGERVFFEADAQLHRISTDAIVLHRELRN